MEEQPAGPPANTTAVQRRVARWTPALKRKFCEALAEGASPTKAAKALELTRQSAYYQRNIDPDFAQAWHDALEEQADLYEDALRRAAIDQRNIGGIIFGLKNLRPNKWRDRHEIDRSVTPVVSASDALARSAQGELSCGTSDTSSAVESSSRPRNVSVATKSRLEHLVHLVAAEPLDGALPVGREHAFVAHALFSAAPMEKGRDHALPKQQCHCRSATHRRHAALVRHEPALRALSGTPATATPGRS